MSERTPRVWPFIVIALLAATAVAGMLMTSGVEIVHALALAVLLAFLPVVAVAQARVVGDSLPARMPVYVSSAVTLVALGGACLAVSASAGGIQPLGLRSLGAGSLTIWVLGMTGVGVAAMAVFRVGARALRLQEAPLLWALLPRNGRERWAFVGLSVAAGFGEEIAYRGYAIPLLAPLLGITGAAALTSAVFGILHAYQGPLGVARTCVVGGCLAWGFLASGSLWVPIGAHIVLDILGGVVLTDWMAVPPSDGGVIEIGQGNESG